VQGYLGRHVDAAQLHQHLPQLSMGPHICAARGRSAGRWCCSGLEGQQAPSAAASGSRLRSYTAKYNNSAHPCVAAGSIRTGGNSLVPDEAAATRHWPPAAQAVPGGILVPGSISPSPGRARPWRCRHLSPASTLTVPSRFRRIAGCWRSAAMGSSSTMKQRISRHRPM
jgi:hypothetical protein